MLVLARKPRQSRDGIRESGHSITLSLPDGRQIVVQIDRSNAYRVMVGIEAPEDVQVVRDDAGPRKHQ